jgi:hypothetical protein
MWRVYENRTGSKSHVPVYASIAAEVRQLARALVLQAATYMQTADV